MKFNIEELVIQSVIGEISAPTLGSSVYVISADGRVLALPGVGGITYNLRIGDRCVGLKADHVEPGVSIKNKEKHSGLENAPNNALNLLSCIGNQAKVVTGDCKGEMGCVTGKHGGIEHVLIDFPNEILEKLVIGDKIQIKSFGLGLEIKEMPNIKVMNIDPELLKKMNNKIVNKKLEVKVTHVIPAHIMGSGLGADQTYKGDYDIQLFDKKTKEKHNLNNLRFGDIVAIIDADHSYGRIYKKGAVSIAVVVHSDCVIAGHGPGATTILTSTKGEITPVIDEKANIANYLGIRKDIF